jgi:hypothetical protein
MLTFYSLKLLQKLTWENVGRLRTVLKGKEQQSSFFAGIFCAFPNKFKISIFCIIILSFYDILQTLKPTLTKGATNDQEDFYKYIFFYFWIDHSSFLKWFQPNGHSRNITC